MVASDCLDFELWNINSVACLLQRSLVQDQGVTVAVKLIHLQRSKRMDGAIPLLLIMTTAMISAKVICLLDKIYLHLLLAPKARQ